MRGFDTWMSANDHGVPQVDPIRQRNMTAFSSELGHAHVLCDGAAYGLPAQSLNPYFLESRWQSDSKGDAAVPIKPTPFVGGEWKLGSNPREDPFDSPLVADASTTGFRHSLGLVRDWLRPSQSHTDAAWDYVQSDPPKWPHWGTALEAFGSDAEAALDNCPVHPLLVPLSLAS